MAPKTVRRMAFSVMRIIGASVLLAERQSGGRGRLGRPWASPLAAHVYLSLARQFGGGLARLGGLSLVAGIAKTPLEANAQVIEVIVARKPTSSCPRSSPAPGPGHS